MSIEFLQIINNNSSTPDELTTTSVRAMALTLAGLDSVNIGSREFTIPLTYGAICSGLLNSEDRVDSYVRSFNSEIKNPQNSLIFAGYGGLDVLVNGRLAAISSLLGGINSPYYQSLLASINAIFCSASLSKLTSYQVEPIINRMLGVQARAVGLYASQLMGCFSIVDIQNILSQAYENVVSGIVQRSPKDSEEDVYYYSYYSTTGLFSEIIDYQRMSDSEAKYYYLSGKIIYNSQDDLGSPCLKITLTGIDGIAYQAYSGLPCNDTSLGAAPINHLSFYRKFPDAPNTSGNEGLSGVYSDFNRAASPELYNFSTGLFSDPATKHLLGSVASDLGILQSINYVESYQTPQPPNVSCYSSAHIGGESPRWRITGYHSDGQNPEHMIPEYAFIPMTGFKIIPLSLDKDYWWDSYSSIRTNPDVPDESILMRALNIHDHLSSGNVGGPIVSNQSFELPCIYLSEEFYNKTMGQPLKGSIYLGTFQNGMTTDAALRPMILGSFITGFEDDGDYDAGDTGNYPKIKFKIELSNTDLTGYNNPLYLQKCLGMGNGASTFSGSGDFIGNNAGHLYSYQRIFTGTGAQQVEVNSSLYFALATEGIIGDNESQYITYVDGFQSGPPEQLTQKVYGYNENQELITYNYYQPSGIIPESGWDEAFPVLDGFSSPITKTQIRENFHPRYSSGIYSSKNTPFLYPSADAANSGSPVAFPLELEINLTVTEEIVREATSRITLQYNPSTSDGIYVLPEYSIGSILNDEGNFTTTLDEADSTTPNKYTGIFAPNKQILVPDNWVDSNFMTHYSSGPIIHSLYSGLNDCSNASQTGVLASDIALNIDNSIMYSIDLDSGFYVIEYETGYFKESSSYVIQKAGAGYYLISSSGNITTYLPFSSADFASVEALNNYFSSYPQHYSFYHAGGLVTVSGAAFTESDSLDEGQGVRIRIEKDCSLAAPLYLKHFGTDINSAGWKYIASQGDCTFVDVYPPDTTSLYNQMSTSATSPTFIQGIRPNHIPYYGCNYSSAPTLELSKRNYNSLPSEISGVPIYDTNCPFHIQNSNNFTSIIKYTLPSFSLSDWSSHPESSHSSLQISDLPICNGTITGSPISALVGSNATYLSGNINRQVIAGSDAIWFEVVGDNNSTPSGQKSSGIAGDAWIGIIANHYGIVLQNACGLSPSYIRTPQNDDVVMQLNLRPEKEISLHTRAMSFTPGNVRRYGEFYQGYDGDFTISDLNGSERVRAMNASGISLLSIMDGYSSSSFEEILNESDFMFPVPGTIGWSSGYHDVCLYIEESNVKTRGVRYFWESFLRANSSTPYSITGYKFTDKSRLVFKINSIKVSKVGPQPVDIEKSIIATGGCIISGEFGYHSQAESAVFSEGVFLEDHSQDSPSTGFYAPSFVSDVLLRVPLRNSGSATSPIQPAPSKCLTRINVERIQQSGNSYSPLYSQSPHNYNKFIVPAVSDLSILNPQSVDFEAILTDDGNIYSNSTFLLSASVAQHKGTKYEKFLNIPDASKIYYVEDIRQFYDSLVTDAVYNSGYFMTFGRGRQSQLTQRSDSTGFLAPIGASYQYAKLGLYVTGDS